MINARKIDDVIFAVYECITTNDQGRLNEILSLLTPLQRTQLVNGYIYKIPLLVHLVDRMTKKDSNLQPYNPMLMTFLQNHADPTRHGVTPANGCGILRHLDYLNRK